MRTLQSEALDGKFLPVRGVKPAKLVVVGPEFLETHKEILELMAKVDAED